MSTPATATVSLTDNRDQFSFGNKYIAIGSLATNLTSDVYVGGGIACSLITPEIKATRTPLLVLVQGILGFIYSYIPGADASLGKLKIFQQSAATSALTEIPASSYAAVDGDTISFLAIFQGME